MIFVWHVDRCREGRVMSGALWAALPGGPGMRSGRVSSAASRHDDLRQMAHQKGPEVPPKVSSRQTG